MIFHRSFFLRLLLYLGMALSFFNLTSPNDIFASEHERASQETNLVKPLEGGADIFWGEIFGESVTRQDEDYNIISDLFIKQGVHLLKIKDKDFDIYFKGRIYHDSLRYYWNNKSEFGIGSRFKPFSKFGLIVFAEFLYGDYTGRDREDEPNPDDSSYLDLQAGMAFWQWWGKESWQISGIELYKPFSGWREVYGDAIYYHHTQNDVICTIDYKEGLMLGQLGFLSFDAYIALEGGWDSKGYEWNNYVNVGPGIRVAPIPNLDLKISAEYFFGRFYRGGFDTVEEKISGAVFTLAFWIGW